MKFAAISDIHSNVYALSAVINDIERRGVNTVVNLGDIFYGPIAPKATFELLREHDFVTVCGNHDRQIYEPEPENNEANPTMQIVIEELGQAAIDWMKSLPKEHYLNEQVYLCHGTPNDDLKYLLENVDTGAPILRSDNEIINLLEEIKAELVLCGHSHMPRAVRLSSGQYVVNPGSVGSPAYTDDEPVPHKMENRNPDASYAIIENIESGWLVQHILVPYDFRRAAADAKRNGRQDWEHFLTTGNGHY